MKSKFLIFFFVISLVMVARKKALGCENPYVPIGEKTFKELEQVNLNLMFGVCHRDKLQKIPKENLEEIFELAKRNPFLRMKTPEAHCLHRAVLLFEELSKKGFKARFLHIKNAPALVGLFSTSGEEVDHFVNYLGSHWVLAVDVTDDRESVREVILDPQFMDSPVPKEEYFIKVTGQTCNDNKPRGVWDCTFEEFEPDTFEIPELEQLGLNRGSLRGCQGPYLSKIEKEISEVNKWNFTTGERIPNSLKGGDKKTVQEDIVLKTYFDKRKLVEDEVRNREILLKKIEKLKPADYLGQKGFLVEGIILSLGDVSEMQRAQKNDQKAIQDFDKVIEAVKENFRKIDVTRAK